MFENATVQTFVLQLVHQAQVVSKVHLQDQELTLKLMSIRLRAATWLSNLSQEDRTAALALVQHAIEQWKERARTNSGDEYETKSVLRLLWLVYKPPQVL